MDKLQEMARQYLAHRQAEHQTGEKLLPPQMPIHVVGAIAGVLHDRIRHHETRIAAHEDARKKGLV